MLVLPSGRTVSRHVIPGGAYDEAFIGVIGVTTPRRYPNASERRDEFSHDTISGVNGRFVSLTVVALAAACSGDSLVVYDAGLDAAQDATSDVATEVTADDAASVLDSSTCKCDGALPVCLDGGCFACTPGATECDVGDGGVVAESCGADGTWQAASCAAPTATCDAGTCVCDGQVCNGTCIDVSSDSENCGRCGHDCCGGACVSGQCQAVTIASNQTLVSGVAVDASDIYWTAYSQVLKCSKTNCGTPTLLASTQQVAATRLVVDATNVYWLTEDGAVRYCSKANCVSPNVLWAPASVQTPNHGTDLAIDSGTVYWTYDDAIFKCPTGGCSGDGGVPSVLVSGLITPWRIVTDSTSMFWGEPFPTNTIQQCSLGGCNNVPTTYTNSSSSDLLVDSTNVYWVSQLGALMSCSKTLCVTPLVMTYGANDGLGQDETSVYWFTNTFPPYTVYACPKVGKCTLPALVTTFSDSPYSHIVMDDACIYFGTTGTVMKAAKP